MNIFMKRSVSIICMYMYICAHTCACESACACVCACVCMSVYTHVCAYLYGKTTHTPYIKIMSVFIVNEDVVS